MVSKYYLSYYTIHDLAEKVSFELIVVPKVSYKCKIHVHHGYVVANKTTKFVN